MKNELINRLIKLCKSVDFSTLEAEKLIKQFDINEPFINSYGEKTTFLGVAVEEENIKMVELLLQNGADANMIVDDENAFWQLQYTSYPEEEFEVSGKADKSDEMRLKIARLLLGYGVNPNLVVEGETLFSYVKFKIFDDYTAIWSRNFKYLTKFFILLVAYGGAPKYLKKEFDKSKLNRYNLQYKKALNGKPLICEITDENGEVVAEIS